MKNLTKTPHMRSSSQFILVAALAALPLAGLVTQNAAAAEPIEYKRIATVTGPSIPPKNLAKNAWCTDINYFDAHTNKYYLADDNNRQVDVIDGTSKELLAPIGKGDFTGPGDCLTGNYSKEGPTGVVAADNLRQLWVGDGNSTVVVYNIDTGHFIKRISTKGMNRADEFAYDAKDHRILVTNPDEVDSHNQHSPYYTLIDAKTLEVIGQPHYVTGAQSLEQPQWDSATDTFFMSVPATATHAGGEIAVIDPISGVASSNPYILGSNCGPSGLSIDEERQEAAVGCFGSVEIISLKDGDIRATIPQINQTDEVWYNWGDHRYYFGSFDLSGKTYIGVVDANNYRFLTTIPINDPYEHATAVDPFTNEVYVPVSNAGIKIFKAE